MAVDGKVIIIYCVADDMLPVLREVDIPFEEATVFVDSVLALHR